jgi:hypothetical protein
MFKVLQADKAISHIDHIHTRAILLFPPSASFLLFTLGSYCSHRGIFDRHLVLLKSSLDLLPPRSRILPQSRVLSNHNIARPGASSYLLHLCLLDRIFHTERTLGGLYDTSLNSLEADAIMEKRQGQDPTQQLLEYLQNPYSQQVSHLVCQPCAEC